MLKHLRFLIITIVFGLLSHQTRSDEQMKVVVAQDGSGDFKTIQEAIDSRRTQAVEQVIFIKNGIYKEKVLVDKTVTHLKFVGESADKTIITYDDHAGMEGIGTSDSYTMKVLGDYITIENVTIENSAGRVGQAVALHVEGDCFTARNCRISGNQDTLYAAGQKSRQYYARCYIEGTTDYIFGGATAVFDSCTLHSKKNSFITAASTDYGNEFGYVFRHCKLIADPDVTQVYLGRPWRDHARVVFIECDMGAHVKPEGWHNWNKPEREKTAFYAEYKSKGPGGDASRRVSWSRQLKEKELKEYSLDNIIGFCSK